MKTLAELQTEIELGLMVYPLTNHDVFVSYEQQWYIFARSDETPEEAPVTHGERALIGGDFSPEGEFLGGGVIFDDCYHSFRALLADWPVISALPIWSTMKTSERLEYEARQQAEYSRQREEYERAQQAEMLRNRELGLDPFGYPDF